MGAIWSRTMVTLAEDTGKQKEPSLPHPPSAHEAAALISDCVRVQNVIQSLQADERNLIGPA